MPKSRKLEKAVVKAIAKVQRKQVEQMTSPAHRAAILDEARAHASQPRFVASAAPAPAPVAPGSAELAAARAELVRIGLRGDSLEKALASYVAERQRIGVSAGNPATQPPVPQPPAVPAWLKNLACRTGGWDASDPEVVRKVTEMGAQIRELQSGRTSMAGGVTIKGQKAVSNF